MNTSSDTDSLGREPMNAKLSALPSAQRGALTDAQIDVLLRPIRGSRVSRDGKGFSHVEAYDIRAHLTRVFGFARWSEEVVSQELVFETSGPSPKNAELIVWTVCYRSRVRLEVCAPDGTFLAAYCEGAIGDASNQPSRADAHDLALKTSQSQALKRAAVNLGDQFGLSLYNGGKLEPLVRQVVGWEPAGEAPADPTAHITALAPEDGATPDTSAREMSPPAPSRGQVPSSPPAAEPPAPASPAPAGGVNTEVPDAGAAPVMDGHDDPAAASDVPAAAGPSPSSAASGDNPLAEILGMANATVLMPPGEASKVLAKAMTLAAKHRLRDVVVPDMTPTTTLGAWLMKLMKGAADTQRAAVSR